MRDGDCGTRYTQVHDTHDNDEREKKKEKKHGECSRRGVSFLLSFFIFMFKENNLKRKRIHTCL